MATYQVDGANTTSSPTIFDSDFEDDSPDLVLTDSDELSSASAERFITNLLNFESYYSNTPSYLSAVEDKEYWFSRFPVSYRACPRRTSDEQERTSSDVLTWYLATVARTVLLFYVLVRGTNQPSGMFESVTLQPYQFVLTSRLAEQLSG